MMRILNEEHPILTSQRLRPAQIRVERKQIWQMPMKSSAIEEESSG